ncbi:MAG TPA: hypothetical protein VFW94_04960 [Candidatus Acidoferrales bacterium]|nr:hypothetical protein [Candidatus Acidoferrales bacterium]
MEMDAYSAYLALKAIENISGADYSRERMTLVSAVISRMQECGGFWQHGAWTGSNRESHMRFSAAALRLLCEALNDRIIVTASVVTEALKKHLSYADKLEQGTWFLHDSLETGESGMTHPHRPLKNTALGSSTGNCLVLNTHVDTLCTLIYVLKNVAMSDENKSFFQSQLASGLSALKAALDVKKAILWRYFSGFDVIVRKVLFGSYVQPQPAAHFSVISKRFCRAAIIRLYFPIRHRIRSRLYGFVFPDGYIERDIALDGTGFGYHRVNIYDLSRLLIQVNEFKFEFDGNLIKQCGRLIDNGIDYAIQKPYWSYLIASTKDSGAAILLCETILARLATRTNDEPVPQSWIHAYCVLRRKIKSPSAAILGYDPFIVEESNKDGVVREGWDCLKLRDGRGIAINLAQETFFVS